jgi:hypothetical protein
MGDFTPEADFYLGRGPNAEYLGSTQTFQDGDPEAVDAWAIFQSVSEEEYTEQDYRDEVSHLVAPDRAWPHPHDNSEATEWAYAYDQGTVYVYRFGVEMAQIRCNLYSMRKARTKLSDGTTRVDARPTWGRRPANNHFPTFEPVEAP